MCGFLSIHSNELIYKKEINNFREKSNLIKHRGPDSFNEYISNYYLSFFYRLSIRDVSSLSDQPILSPCNRYVVSFNGEIYSFDNINNFKFPIKKSDTLSLVELLSKKGIKALHHLRGMFAISIFDKLENTTYLVRDQFGIKPLFFSLKSERNAKNYLISCSEIKALSEIIDLKIFDFRQAARYLKMGVSFDSADTFFSNIKLVKPGYIYKFDKNNKLVSEDKLENNLDSINLDSSKKYDSEAHCNVLNDVLKDHFISDVPISSTISGGIDSSLISIALNKCSSREIKAYTLKSNKFDSELSEEIKAKLNPLSITELEISSDEMSLENIISVIKKLNYPIRTSSWLLIDKLFKEIKLKNKTKVILVGEGGDELYSGYKRLINPYLFCLNADKRYSDFENSIDNFSHKFNTEKDQIIYGYEKFLNNLYQLTDYEDSKYWNIFDDKLKSINERHLPGISFFKEIDKNTELFYKSNLKRYYQRSLIPSDLMILDNLSMSYGLELRVPLIDIKLFKYVMKYSYIHHFQGGFNKYMLRDASQGTPDLIRWNPHKKQRPNLNSFIVYDLHKDFIRDLLLQSEFLNNKLAVKLFEKDMFDRNDSSSDFWFRLTTFSIFHSLY